MVTRSIAYVVSFIAYVFSFIVFISARLGVLEVPGNRAGQSCDLQVLSVAGLYQT
jgi:hypothetical protein